MNWKTLGAATLITCGVFVCLFLIFALVARFPWTLIILLFVFMLCVFYKLLSNEEDDEEEEMR